MKINTIRSNTTFGAYYRIPNTSENVKRLGEVMSLYQYLRHEPAVSYIGETPISVFVKERFKDFAAKSGGSFEWLRMNSDRFGVKLPSLDTDFISVITSRRDISELLDSLEKVNKHKFGFISKISNIIQIVSDVRNKPKEVPTHVFIAEQMAKAYNKETEFYRSHLNSKNIIKVSDIKELITKMMTERTN